MIHSRHMVCSLLEPVAMSVTLDFYYQIVWRHVLSYLHILEWSLKIRKTDYSRNIMFYQTIRWKDLPNQNAHVNFGSIITSFWNSAFVKFLCTDYLALWRDSYDNYFCMVGIDLWAAVGFWCWHGDWFQPGDIVSVTAVAHDHGDGQCWGAGPASGQTAEPRSWRHDIRRRYVDAVCGCFSYF